MAEAVKIKVKDLKTGRVEIFDVGAGDTMKDVLESMKVDANNCYVNDAQTGRFFDITVKFGDTDKRSFVIINKA
jgi:arginine decarboxylase-like protein